jgi:hypothetical protein
MAKIQIDLNSEQDKIVEVYKIINSFHTKENAIKSMIEYFKVEIKPKKLNNKEYFK